jgi:hypothetical protein
MHRASKEQVKGEIRVPLIFRLVSREPDLGKSPRMTAYSSVYASSVSKPLIKAVRAKIADETEWSPTAVRALEQLVRIEGIQAGIAAVKPAAPVSKDQKNQKEPALIETDPLFKYVLPPAEYAKYERDKGVYQDALNIVCPRSATAETVAKCFDTDNATGVVVQAMQKFTESLPTRLTRGPADSPGASLRAALEKFKTDEDALIGDFAAAAPPVDSAGYTALAGNWNTRLAALQKSDADAVTALGEIERGGGPSTLADLARQDVKVTMAKAVDDCRRLLEPLGSAETASPALPEKLRVPVKAMQEQSANLEISSKAALKESLDSLEQLDHDMLDKCAGLDGKSQPRFATRFDSYQRAGSLLVDAAKLSSKSGSESVNFLTLPEDLKKFEDSFNAAKTEIGRALGAATTDRSAKAPAICTFVLERLAGPAHRYLEFSAVLQSPAVASKETFVALVKQRASLERIPSVPMQVPLTKLKKFEMTPDMQPQAAAPLVAAWGRIDAALQNDAAQPTLNHDELLALYKVVSDRSVKAYVTDLAKRWQQIPKDAVTIDAETVPAFQAFQEELPKNHRQVMLSIDSLCKQIESATSAFAQPGQVPQGWEPVLQPFNDATALIGSTRQALSAADAYPKGYSNMLQNWAALGTDPKKAADKLRAAGVRGFQDDYMPQSSVTEANIFDDYWKALAMRGLELLSGDGNPARKQLEELRTTYNQFPLAAPTKPGELTEAQLAEALVCLTAVDESARRAEEISTAAGVDKDFLAKYQKLCELELTKEDAAMLARQRGLLNLLLAPQSSGCKVVLLDAEQQKKLAGANSAVQKIYSITLNDERQIGVQPVQLGAINKLGSRDGLSFKFKETPEAANYLATVDSPGPWAPLRLIYQYRAAPDPDGKGLAWNVELPVDKTSTIWVQLQFDKLVPNDMKPKE